MQAFFYYYAWIFGVFTIGSALIKIGMKLSGRYQQVPTAIQIEELCTVPLLMLGLLGMVGYLQDLALFGQLFWQLYAGLLLLHTVGGFWLPKLRAVREQLSLRKFLVLNLVALLMGGPMYGMVIAYAFFTYPVA